MTVRRNFIILAETLRTMKNYSHFLKEAGGVLKDEAWSALDVILPRKCLVCGRRLNVNEKYLCIYCEADLPLTRYWSQIHNPMADKLNEMIQRGITAAVTGRDGKAEVDTHPNARPSMPVKYSYATAFLFYHGEAGYRKIPQQLKYHGDISEGKFYAQILGKMIAGSPHFQDIDAIIPVPLHWLRRWNRGYNQAEVIARAISGETGIPVRTDIIRRVRLTKTQTKLGITAKLQNVSGAFALTARASTRIKSEKCPNSDTDISGIRHILVVDDVFTTGATICACINALRTAFNSNVRISAATLGYVS